MGSLKLALLLVCAVAVFQLAVADFTICHRNGESFEKKTVTSAELTQEMCSGAVIPYSRRACIDYDADCAPSTVAGQLCWAGTPGYYACQNDHILCVAGSPPCVGLDTDEDGVVDVQTGDNCVLAEMLGVCRDGQYVCTTSGSLVCTQLVTQADHDSCGDGLDNDCDGTADNDDSVCDDSDACTIDTCTSSACVHTAVGVCPGEDQCHIATCNSLTGCPPPTLTLGATCDDGDACTENDQCQPDGTCRGTAITCAAYDHCHDIGTCNPSTGLCSNPVKTNGASCNDGNECMPGTCQDGVCGDVSPLTDGEVCTGGTCLSGSCFLADRCLGVGAPYCMTTVDASTTDDLPELWFADFFQNLLTAGTVDSTWFIHVEILQMGDSRSRGWCSERADFYTAAMTDPRFVDGQGYQVADHSPRWQRWLMDSTGTWSGGASSLSLAIRDHFGTGCDLPYSWCIDIYYSTIEVSPRRYTAEHYLGGQLASPRITVSVAPTRAAACGF